MGLIDRLFNSIRRIDKGTDSSLTSIVRQFGGMPVYPDPDVERFLEAYTENAAVYSIVNLAARKFSFIPRYLVVEEDEEQEKSYKRLLKQGQFLKAQKVKTKAYSTPQGKAGPESLEALLARPNPTYGQDLFYYSIYVSYKICGEAFVWLNRGDIEGMEDDTADQMPVLEMYWLPADLVTIIPDPLDVWGVMGYELDIDGKRAFVRKSDVIHWKTFNPFFDGTTREHLRGLLPPINKILQQEEDSTDAAVAMYQHGGARGVLTEKSLKNISVEQKTKIEEITSKRINNKDLKSSIANLQGDWAYIDIGKDSVDMQLLEGNDKAFAKLCHAFGVPPGLFLIDQTYENQRSNRKRMLSELIMPDCASFNDEMNRLLLPAFGLKGQKIEPDYSELPEMQEDMKDMIVTLKDAPITKNEFREAIGYDPLPVEEMDKVFVTSNEVPIDEIGEMDKILNAGPNGQGNRENSNGKVSNNGQGKKLSY
jgi:HK97 family phage portal protein